MISQSRICKQVSLLVVTGLALAVAGCPMPIGTVTMAQNGGFYNLVYGGTLRVQLPTDELGNCQWRITAMNQTLLQRADNPDVTAPGTRRQLTDGTFVEDFLFQGVERGTTILAMEYRCGGAATGTTFTLQINIVGTGI